ncbi:hypothetical protein Tco_0562383 [Tanacetum coccineum]
MLLLKIPLFYVSLIQQFWQTATASTLDNGEMEITATIDGNVKTVSEVSIRRHLKLEDSDGISNLPTTEIFEQLALMGVDIPLFPTMLVQGLVVQGEGSTHPVESHHTPTSVPPTSQPPISSTSRRLTRQESMVPQPRSPTQTPVADETIHEERGDSVERAATTDASLDAELDSGYIIKTQSTTIPNKHFPQEIGSGGSPRRQETILGDMPAQTRFERLSKQPHDSPLPRVNTLGSDEGSLKLQELAVLRTWESMANKRTARSIFGKLILAASSYFVWLERNNRLFKNVKRTPEELRDVIMVTVRLKLLSFKFKNSAKVISLLDVGKMPSSLMLYVLLTFLKEMQKKNLFKKVQRDKRLEKAQNQLKNQRIKKKTEFCVLCDLDCHKKGYINDDNSSYGARKFWKIIRVVKWWSLVKEKFTSTDPTEDKERELWVELKRLFEPDTDDELWKLQKHIHDNLTWRLYDSCGVHHVSTEDGIDICMLVEKEYPLSRGTLTLMLVAKLLVEQDSEMSRELLRKIFMQGVLERCNTTETENGEVTTPQKSKQTTEEVMVNDKYPEQLVTINVGLSPECKYELRKLLRANLDVFAWKPSDMIGILR